ncbi:MAG: peroxiredoxin family protein [Lachnoclostridium sp.]|nr:peroxiredoxin family protein [Lachnoclostridium sp.]
MKKTVLFIALFALLLVNLSAHTSRAVKAAEGYMAPAIELTTDDSTQLDIDNFKGKWTLVNFWDSSDPVSRIAAGEYDAMARNLSDENEFELLSINLDKNAEIFEAVVKSDGLSEGTIVNVSSPVSTQAAKAYNLDRSRNAYLINPSGVIVAVNPDARAIMHRIRG